MEKWKTILALILLLFAVIFNWGWFWSLFVAIGLIHIIINGKIHFVEEVTKKDNPKLFWGMVVIWSFLALYSILSYLGYIVS